MFWGLLGAGVFAWLGGVFMVLGLRCGRGQVPYRSPLGLRGERVRASVPKWEAAHRAAAPFVTTAAIICFLQTGAFAWAAVSPELKSSPYIAILALVGALLVGLLLFLAQAAGTREAR